MSKAVTAAVLSCGEEILDGRILDANSQWLADRLFRLGLPVSEMATIGDAPGAFRQVLARLDGQVDLILSTGGLGPTVDDRVRQEVADHLGVGLTDIDGAVQPLADLHRQQHQQEAPPWFTAQGRMPQGAIGLRNRAGTAWGFQVELSGGSLLVCLPGPPVECQRVWHDEIEATLKERFGRGRDLAFGLFHTVSIPESAVEARIRDLLEASSPRYGITAHGKKVSISVLAEGNGADTRAEEILEQHARLLHERLGDWLWGRDDETLEGVVVRRLAVMHRTVATAESCTGGRLGQALTRVSGASEVYGHGWVTYANRAKVDQLGVDPQLFDGPNATGAVSEEVAMAMAQGARERSGADYALAITGIAGPSGGSEQKPVGTVWIGLATPKRCIAVHRQQWVRAGREGIQHGAVMDALEILRRDLLAIPDLPPRTL